MNIRHYTAEYGITEDYHKVRAFLIELGYCEYSYARWDWMTTHYHYMDRSRLSSMGLLEEDGKVKAAVIFDGAPGWCALLTLPGYEKYRPELLSFADKNLRDDKNKLVIICPETDTELSAFLAASGCVPTPSCERDAVFLPDETSTDYTLPEGFRITDLEERFDPVEYERCMFRGFGHEEAGEDFDILITEENLKISKDALIRPGVRLSDKVFAEAANKEFAAHCGIWYDDEAGYAVVEPVCTVPEYRKMGLGKAVVLEAISRVKARGCKKVYVGSDQQFYYSIGFRPCRSNAEWELKAK